MSTKVVIKNVRLSYPHLFAPFSIDGKQEPKFSCMLLLPKSDEAGLEALRAAERAAAEIGKSTKFGGKIPQNLATIIRDGDDFAEDYPEREGHWFLAVSANADRKPGVVDQSVQPILDQSEVYAGCFVNASLNAFPYEFGGKKGISFGLNNVQKVADGEPLGSVSRAEDDFEPVEEGNSLL